MWQVAGHAESGNEGGGEEEQEDADGRHMLQGSRGSSGSSAKDGDTSASQTQDERAARLGAAVASIIAAGVAGLEPLQLNGTKVPGGHVGTRVRGPRPYCLVLPFTVVYRTVLYWTGLHGVVLYRTVLCCPEMWHLLKCC